jgi:hypothetical protein
MKRILSLMLSLCLMLSSFSLAVYADDAAPAANMINIPDSSPWKGSVFGDVGGQDKIDATNFEITEHPDGSVTLRSSNNRGKIASDTEGIAYYYQDVSYLDNYELKAKAHVDAWTANNQVAFGIMVRERILDNQSASFTSDYVAVGALDQAMKGFYKKGSTLVKSGYEFSADPPAANRTYELTLRKYGNVYSIRIGDQSYEIVTDSRMEYAGLFTSRNTTVTFTDVELYVLPSHRYATEFQFRYFGSNTSGAKNPAPVIEPDEGLTMKASGGKISSTDEGISFYYVEMDADSNFEISADVKVKSFNGDSSINNPNQKSFGIMVRDEVGEHGNTATQTSNYVAVGALDLVMKAFYKKDNPNQKLDTYTANPPAANETYHLSLRKNGDVYVMSVNGEEQTIELDGLFSDEDIYVGFYVARDAEITLSNGYLADDRRKVLSLSVDAAEMKTDYLVGESLELTGLKVTAVTEDAEGNLREEVLNSNEYVVTGFNSGTPGTNTIQVHFHGLKEPVDLTIWALSVVHLEVEFYPAKTVYYPGDRFDPEGMTVYAEYNSKASKYLTPDLYEISIPDATETDDGYVFESPGTYTVRVISTETPDQYDEFDVTVKDAELVNIEITKPPAKSQYFLGNELDLSGMVVYANYDDGSSVRLMRDDYAVSGFDSDTEGDKTITLTYKGKTATFVVHVKEREVTHLEVTQYPKTTYTVGQSFDPTGMVVSKVYDNGDRDLYTDYDVDMEEWDSSQPGVTVIRIIPDDTTLAPITLPITIREAKEYEWQWTRFGQSTSNANNKVTFLEDGSIKLEALGGSAGKITGDHDGITYYYTVIDGHEDNFVLSADIQVIDYAKNPHDGQESFGIMARDANGVHGDSSVFASNIAAVGGYSGGTRNDNGTQLFVRTGVESPDGAGSQGIKRVMLKNERPDPTNTHPAAKYRLTLAKTNSGFVGKLEDNMNTYEAILFEPDILTVQDDKIYVGFYVARQATIVVSNIEFEVTAAATDAPRVYPPVQAIEPAVQILSLDRTSETNYVFRAKANASGAYTLKLGQTTIAQDVSGEAGKIVEIPATLAMGNNKFTLTFIPDDTQVLTSYDRIISNFKVEVRTYRDGEDIYVSPTGTPEGDGSQERPLDLDTAIDFVLPGQKIIVQDGRYVRKSSLVIRKYNDGREDAMKMLYAAEGANPIIDFDKKSEGVVHSGNYWHVKGLSFTRSADNYKGYTLGGNHNIIELNKFYANGDTGFQISRTDDATSIEDWPSYNLVLNNESYDNKDPSHNNADGFAAKLTSGVGNVFRGNVAHHNIDDGWDLYTKAGQGAIGAILLEGNITYRNGMLTDGTVGNGDKNGFKLGGEGIHVPHIVRNNIAFENGAMGFTSNSNPGVILENNISFNNGGANLNLSTYTNIQEDFQLSGFVSYRTQGTASDNVPERLKASDNFLFDGTKSVNADGKVMTNDNFASLVPEVLPFPRDSQGNLILGDFLKLIDDVIPPGEVQDVKVISGNSQLTFTWTDPANLDLEKIRISGEGETVMDAVYAEPGAGSYTFTDLINGVTYFFRITTIDQSGNESAGLMVSGTPQAPQFWSPLPAKPAPEVRTGDDGAAEIVPVAEWDGDRISTSIQDEVFSQALESAAADENGKKTVIIRLEQAAKQVQVELPAQAVSSSEPHQVVISSSIGILVLPSNMLSYLDLGEGDTVQLVIAEAETADDSERKAVEIHVKVNDEIIDWNNAAAAVTVEIAYVPTTIERLLHEFLAVVFIDDEGNQIPIYNGRYDPETGRVVFTTSHFSRYAVVFAPKTFSDIASYPWAQHEIEVLATKGIINGTSEERNTFTPGANISRADYILLLVKTLGLQAEVKDNFADVRPGDYYYEAVGIAKALGITNGDGKGNFNPRAEITRQDMFTLTARALAVVGYELDAAPGAVLDSFTDKDQIASYAQAPIAALVADGLVRGSGGKLNPQDSTTRAEAAVFLYRLYNLP